MLRTILLPAALAGLLVLATSGEADAYGVTRTGSTTVSASGGVQHTGSTSVSGPYGSYSGSHSGSYSGTGTASRSYSGSYSGPQGNASFSGSANRVYSPNAYSGYSVAGSATESYTRGVVRFP